MSVSTSTPVVGQPGHIRRFGLTILAATVLAVGGWAIVHVAGGGSQHARPSATTQSSVLASLSPQARKYVEGIMALTPAQIAAAFGTGAQTNASVLASLSPANRRYVEAITALTPPQIAGAFGTDWAKSWGVLQSLSPANRRYVEGIMALTPAQIAAAFGTGS
jgi:hypothetical protein